MKESSHQIDLKFKKKIYIYIYILTFVKEFDGFDSSVRFHSAYN